MDTNEGTLKKEFDSKNITIKIRSSARARDIAERSRLSSADTNVLEEHDQFWRDHKILLKLFQVLGVMPVSRNIGKITFSWTSKATIYAICFYILTSVLVFLVGYQRLKILIFGSKKFDEYIYSIIFIMYLVPHFWIPFVGWGVAREVVIYKNSWTHFQLKYYRLTGKSLVFPNLSLLIIIISLGCLILAVVFLLSLSMLLAGFTLVHTTAYLHIITMINMNCALWYINCRATGDASKSLGDSLEEDIKEQCSAYIVAHYRILWLSLSEILQRLGNAYSRTYSTYSLFMFVNITISVYGFMSEIIDHGFVFTFKVIGLIVDCLYCLVLLFVFCDCSQTATIKITKRVKGILMNIDIAKIDEATRREIDLFIVAIKLNPPVVSLKGYGNVDRKFFTSDQFLRDRISEMHHTITLKTKKNYKRNFNLHSLKYLTKPLGKKYKRIVSGVNIDELTNQLAKFESIIKESGDTEIKTRYKQSIIDHIQFYLPKVCRLIYIKEKPDVRIELKTVVISLEKINLLRQQYESISVPCDINKKESIARIQLGSLISRKFKMENAVCIGKILLLNDYFNTTDNVYGINLYSMEDDEYALDATINEYDILINIPVKKSTNNSKCAIWGDTWDTTKCRSLAVTQSLIKCGCKSLGYFSIVAVESPTSSPMLKSGTFITTSTPFSPFDSVSTKLTTIVADKLIASTTKYQLETGIGTGFNATQRIADKTHLQGSDIAITTIIIILCVSIIGVISTWSIIYYRNKKKNSVHDSNISYGRYYDEHTLDELPE